MWKVSVCPLVTVLFTWSNPTVDCVALLDSQTDTVFSQHALRGGETSCKGRQKDCRSEVQDSATVWGTPEEGVTPGPNNECSLPTVYLSWCWLAGGEGAQTGLTQSQPNLWPSNLFAVLADEASVSSCSMTFPPSLWQITQSIVVISACLVTGAVN